MRNIPRILAAAAVCCALIGAMRSARAATVFWYTMQFDGGYGFFLNSGGEMEVISPKELNGEVPHPMYLRRERGAFVKMSLGTEPPKTKAGDWDVTGFDMYIDSSGDATKLDLPPLVAVNEPANDCFQPSTLNSSEVNNRYFLPNLKDIAPGLTPSLSIDNIRSRVFIRKGRMAITRVGGCWQFLTPFNAPLGKPHAIVRGVASIKHTLNITADDVELVLMKKGANTPVARMVFEPRLYQAKQEVMLWVGRFDGMAMPVPVGADLHEITMVYRLAGAPSPWLLARPFKFNQTGEFASPGDECPPTSYVP